MCIIMMQEAYRETEEMEDWRVREPGKDEEQ
jgi:hypothetical protein